VIRVPPPSRGQKRFHQSSTIRSIHTALSSHLPPSPTSCYPCAYIQFSSRRTGPLQLASFLLLLNVYSVFSIAAHATVSTPAIVYHCSRYSVLSIAVHDTVSTAVHATIACLLFTLVSTAAHAAMYCLLPLTLQCPLLLTLQCIVYCR
jgi:hypothetical protein